MEKKSRKRSNLEAVQTVTFDSITPSTPFLRVSGENVVVE